MKDGKFNLGVYAAGCVLSLLGGLCFSKAQYFKGKADAYNECTDMLKEFDESIQEAIDKAEEVVEAH